MKGSKLARIIITLSMVSVTLVVAAIAYSAAWFKAELATPYTFEVHANGVLYVYVESVTVDNEEALVPAVAIPGAIEEGLHYDVLTAYNAGDANPSYISKVATVTPIRGDFYVYNEGYAYDKLPLPQDAAGYTLYPVINSSGAIVWNDPSDHSQGWQQRRKPTEWDTSDPEHPFAIEWSKELDYEPLYDETTGAVTWRYTDEVVLRGEPDHVGQEWWICKEVLREGSAECIVHLNIRFKASEDGLADDYYDTKDFTIKRLYVTRQDEIIPEGTGMGPSYGNSGVTFTDLSEDYTRAAFIMYGAEHFYLHAEVYLSQPDELMNPELRGKDVYMAISVEVEVNQFDEEEAGE